MRDEHIVSVAWLRDRLDDPSIVIADVRWSMKASGRDAYRAGHIPGAYFVDLDSDLSSPGQGPGRHPLPTVDTFARALSRMGVTRDSTIVVYDDLGGAIAARMWWLLRYFGLDNGRVLDGGLTKFIELGGVAQSTEPPPDRTAAVLELTPRADMVVTASDVAARGEATSLVDARAPERYRGEHEPIDPRAGHIPGAINLPWEGNLADGVFASDETLRARFDDGPTIMYCGSGVTACHNLLALAITDRPPSSRARLYVGSWSDWSSDAARPVG